jgi:cytoskeletal protein CcmA (bactofilin family)
LFEIRKKELKFRRKDETVLKIEGKSDEGTIKITESNLLDIKRHGQIIGHVVLEHTAK